MSAKSAALAGSFLVFALLGSAAARAQPLYWDPFAPLPEYHGPCQQACERDYAPCDPLYFKQADRRCQVDPKARGHHN